MKKMPKKQEKEWERALEIANKHGFLNKTEVKDLANKLYNNALNKLGDYSK